MLSARKKETHQINIDTGYIGIDMHDIGIRK